MNLNQTFAELHSTGEEPLTLHPYFGRQIVGVNHYVPCHERLCNRESDQPPRWFDLGEEWESVFPEDRGITSVRARRLAAAEQTVKLSEQLGHASALKMAFASAANV